MTDVVEIAKGRHVWLAAELAKVGDFLRMADALLKQNLSNSNKALCIGDGKVAIQTVSMPASPHSAATEKNVAETKSEDLPTRDLKAEERVNGSHTNFTDSFLRLKLSPATEDD